MVLPEPFGYLALTFNFRNENIAFLRDARVRRALMLAADQATMVALVYHGLSHENRIPVPVAPPIWLNPAAQKLRYDPQAARAALDEAGFRLGPDGIRAANGVRLAFSAAASAETPERAQLLQILQHDLRQAGVELHIRLMSTHQLEVTLAGPPAAWDAILLASTLTGMPDGTGYFDTGGNNGGGYSDARMDALIRASVDQPGPAGLFAYEDYAAAQQPANILPQGELPLLVANRVGGAENFSNPQAFWTPEDLWVRDAECGTADSGAQR
jgi:peptide/nickel transport system substrate-binding protein